MSKSRGSQEQTSTRIEGIRAFHELGCKALQLPSNMPIDAQAMKLKCKPGLLAVARRFAARYSQAKLDALCDQIAEHRPAFGTSHVGILIAVPPSKRLKLQTRCIKKNWSVRQLIAAKVKSCKPRSRGGRYPQVTASNAPVLIAEHANSYCRLVARMMKPLNGKPCVLDDMPSETRMSIMAGLPAMKRLRKAAQAQLGTTQTAG